MPLVRRDIVNMARFPKRDITEFLPDATEAETLAAGGSVAPASVSVDVDKLETAHKTDPKNYKGWIAQAEARSSLGDADGAAQVLADARAEFRGAPFVLDKFAEAERMLGLDLVGSPARGSSAADIEAASGMTKNERGDMIAGMVAGLAARLEEDPNVPDRWVMLSRSYTTMGKPEEAETAYKTAQSRFAGNDRLLSQIAAQVRQIRSP